MLLFKMNMKKIMMNKSWQKKDLGSFKIFQDKLELVKLSLYKAILIMKIQKDH